MAITFVTIRNRIDSAQSLIGDSFVILQDAKNAVVGRRYIASGAVVNSSIVVNFQTPAYDTSNFLSEGMTRFVYLRKTNGNAD